MNLAITNMMCDKNACAEYKEYAYSCRNHMHESAFHSVYSTAILHSTHELSLNRHICNEPPSSHKSANNDYEITHDEIAPLTMLQNV